MPSCRVEAATKLAYRAALSTEHPRRTAFRFGTSNHEERYCIDNEGILALCVSDAVTCSHLYAIYQI